MEMILDLDEALSAIGKLRAEQEELSQKLADSEKELEIIKLRYQKAMEDLDNQSMYTKIILKDSPESIMFFDSEKRLIFASNKALDDLMINHMDNFNVNCLDLKEKMDHQSYEILNSAMQDSLEQNRAVKTDFVLHKKNGEKIYFKTNVMPIYDEGNGQLVGISVISYDVTEITMQKEHAEEAMLRAEKERAHAQMAMSLAERAKQIAEVSKQKADEASQAKSQFLANMSHEIRTPMNAIVGISEMIKASTKEKITNSYIEDIIKSSRWLQQMINDVLDFSKIEANKFDILPINFNLITSIQSIDDAIEILANEKGLHYQSTIHPGVPEIIFADEIRIKQILLNILNNAIKYTPKGRVDFDIRADNDKLIFEISDSGIGIMEKNIPFLFDAFRQFDSKKNRYIVGTGLGLSIAKRLCELMKGDIFVTSSYGIGSTFRVILPFVIGDSSAVEKTEDIKQISAPKASVLVVDDIYMNLKVAKGLFLLFGIQIDTAVSGEESIKMVQEKDYDIVFMDHMMPGMDGIMTTDAIRNLGGKYETLKIIALTANAIAGAKEMFLQNKFDDYLAKPIEKSQLNDLLSKNLPPELICHEIDNKEEEPECTQLTDEQNSILERLSSTGGIDTKKGLNYNACHIEDYLKSIELLIRMVYTKIENMKNTLHDGRLDLLAIDVHSLKGGLLTIGEPTLSQKAADLEIHAKSENISYCQSNLGKFCEELKSFADKIGDIISSEKNPQQEQKKGDLGFLKEHLLKAGQYLQDFESDEAMQTLDEMQEYTFGEEKDKCIQEIRFAIDEFDFSKARAVCENLIDNIY